MNNITFGQYLPGDSLLHKMDPRMKIVLLLLLMISNFIGKNFITLVLVAVATVMLVILSQINLKIILKGIKPIVLIVVITALLNLFYGTGEPLVEFGFLKITQAGIYSSIFMSMRVIFLVVQGLMLTYTTTPTSLTDAMESLMKPLKHLRVDVHAIAMTMTIALRFIPTRGSAKNHRRAKVKGRRYGKRQSDKACQGDCSGAYSAFCFGISPCKRTCRCYGMPLLQGRRRQNKNECYAS